jgi:hypothetical protein
MIQSASEMQYAPDLRSTSSEVNVLRLFMTILNYPREINSAQNGPLKYCRHADCRLLDHISRHHNMLQPQTRGKKRLPRSASDFRRALQPKRCPGCPPPSRREVGRKCAPRLLNVRAASAPKRALAPLPDRAGASPNRDG